ncbi:MAG: hypothetical protein O3A63_06475 [Proteobacteria bacterium]|nr:hypothetical protein [Pseudomonadota bacterium]
MSIDRRRTAIVFEIVKELVAGGKTEFRPGDVNSILRERNQPMGTWEVRGEFSRLEDINAIAIDAATGNWHLVDEAAKIQAC